MSLKYTRLITTESGDVYDFGVKHDTDFKELQSYAHTVLGTKLDKNITYTDYAYDATRIHTNSITYLNTFTSTAYAYLTQFNTNINDYYEGCIDTVDRHVCGLESYTYNTYAYICRNLDETTIITNANNVAIQTINNETIPEINSDIRYLNNAYSYVGVTLTEVINGNNRDHNTINVHLRDLDNDKLSRVTDRENPERNRMETNINMSGNQLLNVSYINNQTVDNLTITSNVVIGGDSIVSGDIISYSLSTTANAYIGCDLRIYGNVAAGKYVEANGSYSHAEGYATKAQQFADHAEGNYTYAYGGASHAEGNYTYAIGSYSHAEGTHTYAIGSSSHAEGKDTHAIGSYSHAEGLTTFANGNYSHAEGVSTTSSGDRSHTEGYGTVALGDSAHGEGYQTQAIGNYSHAEGYNTYASGDGSHVEGTYTYAIANNAHAEGYQTYAYNQSEHAEGQYNISRNIGESDKRTIHTIGIGDYSNDRKNAVEVRRNGDMYLVGVGAFTGTSDPVNTGSGGAMSVNTILKQCLDSGAANSWATQLGKWNQDSNRRKGYASFAEGYNTEATNEGSHAEGIETISNDAAAHAEGQQTIANGEYSHAEGYATEARSEASHAEGRYTYAIGSASHAEGTYTYAIGSYSHAEGKDTHAIGSYSHAEGCDTIASGFYSHAEGLKTIASGPDSHTEGYKTQATKWHAHAEGEGTLSTNEATHTEGWYTIATARAAHSEGTYTYAYGLTAHAEGMSTYSLLKDIFKVKARKLTSNEKSILLNTYSFNANVVALEGGTSGSLTLGNIEDGLREFTVSYEPNQQYTYTGTVRRSRCLNIESVVGDMLYVDGSIYNEFPDVETGLSDNSYLVIKVQYSNKFGFAGGSFSHVEGYDTITTGDGAHAEGCQTQATGDLSHAEGWRTKATAIDAHAEGLDSEATASHAHAEGYGTKATGQCSHTEGRSTYASDSSSHAEGVKTTAANRSAHAEGTFTYASGLAAHAEGMSTYGITNTDLQNLQIRKLTEDEKTIVEQACGKHYDYIAKESSADIEDGTHGWLITYKYAPGQTISTYMTSSRYVHLDNGNINGDVFNVEASIDTYPWNMLTYQYTTVNAKYFDRFGIASGQFSHVEGYDTQATDDAAHAEGDRTKATAEASHAEGFKTIASGKGSHAGGYSTEASGLGSFAHGVAYNKIIASNDGSHAEGYSGATGKIISSGKGSHAEGYVPGQTTPLNMVSSGNGSHAEGCVTYASGDGSHAEGTYTYAIANSAHAEGYATYATAPYSHAEGYATYATANYSHAAGKGTYADKEAMTVVGKYNATDVNNALFVVGNGTGPDSARKNAFVITNSDAQFNVPISVENSLSTSGQTTLHNRLTVNSGATINGGSSGAVTKITYKTGSNNSWIIVDKNSVNIGSKSLLLNNGNGTGNCSTYIGFVSDSGITGSGPTYIQSKITYIGYNTTSTNRHTYIGNSNDIVYIKGQKYTTGTSDVRLKNIISDIDLNKGYEMIEKCQTVLYSLKDDADTKQQIGLIAQEVQEFFPEIVDTNTNGYLYINYDRLAVILLRVMKSIIDRLTALENK